MTSADRPGSHYASTYQCALPRLAVSTHSLVINMSSYMECEGRGPLSTTPAVGRMSEMSSSLKEPASVKKTSSLMESADASSNSNSPRILLMGLKRSGKSSIQKVVFHKMSPNETLFLESTSKIVKEEICNSSFVQFAVWDCPSQLDLFNSAFDSASLFERCGAIVFVIDAQDDYEEAIALLTQTLLKATAVNADIKFELFIHKVDGLTDDTKIETQRDIHQRSSDHLQDHGLEHRVQISFYLTSIYDHSIFEAFSKVVQKLIPELPTLEGLLNIFISNSGIEKAFLFDVVSKIYIATDSSPVDMQSYELCCDMIDVVIDVSCIYGLNDDSNDAAFDERSASIIRLNNSTILYLKEVSRVLALVCIVREENFSKQGLIDYNFIILKNAIEAIFKVKRGATNNMDEIVASSLHSVTNRTPKL